MKMAYRIASLLLCFSMTSLPAVAEDNSKMDADIMSYFDNGFSYVTVGIRYPSVSEEELVSRVNEQAEAYRESLAPDTDEAAAEASVMRFWKEAYHRELRSANAEQAKALAAELEITDNSMLAYSTYSPTISASLTKEETEAVAAHASVESVLCAGKPSITAFWHDAPNTVLPFSMGDPNGDGIVDASDAARVLITAAEIGSGNAQPTYAEMAQSDANDDGSIDASDAAQILIYAAGVGSGNVKEHFQAFMYQQNGTVLRLLVSNTTVDQPSPQIITGREELAAFTEASIGEIKGINKTYGMQPSGRYTTDEVLNPYDDTFFEDNVLAAITISANSISDWYEISSIEAPAAGNYRITVDKMAPDFSEPMGCDWVILVSLPKQGDASVNAEAITETVHVASNPV